MHIYQIFLIYRTCILFLILLLNQRFTVNCDNGRFTEQLLIRPLRDGMVNTNFRFTSQIDDDIENLYLESHSDIFPLALKEFIGSHFIKELKFSLARGHWKVDKWGFPLRYQSNGAELYVVFSHLNPHPWKSWKQVTSSLSGHFCASLNFIDKATTVQPKLSLKPEGLFMNNTFKLDRVFYAALAHETVCTENLTPWKKLLPCFHKAGLASLLNAVHILNSNYFSISVDVKSVCKAPDCKHSSTQLTQTLMTVYNPRAMFNGELKWSIIKFFGSSLKETCPLADKSEVFVESSHNNSQNSHTLSPNPHQVVEVDASGEKRRFARYDVVKLLAENKKANLTQFNIFSVYHAENTPKSIAPPPITASRYITGYGVYQGGIACRIENNSDKPKKIVYFDVIPWYLRIYFHTLKITSNNVPINPTKVVYNPAKDRIRWHHIELALTLPPKSSNLITFEFERAFLKWTEYPPDANHGVYAGSATISFLLDNFANVTFVPGDSNFSQPQVITLKTESLLVSLPTPDFSMTYNVICLVSTVVSLAFGPIHNFTTKRPKLALPRHSQSLKERITSFFSRRS